MDDIVLERGNTTNVMKLDQEEENLLNEIQISDEPAPAPVRKKPTAPKRPAMRAQPAAFEDVEAFGNPNKAQPPRKPQPEFVDYGEGEDEYEDEQGGGFDEEYSEMEANGEMPSPGYASIDDEKLDLLNKLARLEKKGFHTSKKLTAYSPIDELRSEFKRITYSIEIDQSVRFSRRMLIACTTGLEFLNKRYNPFDLQLEGWSESVMENVDDYDGVFEDLYNKYKTKMHVAPEVKLIMMLGGSGMMFHLTNSMFKAAIPNMNDVMKQNPDLINSMMNAVKNTTAPQGDQADPTQRPVQQETFDTGGRREMQGPGLDISSLMGGIMMPPPPMNTTSLSPVREEPAVREDDVESISDIVSISGESTGGEVKNVNVGGEKKKRGRKSKKNEVSL